MGWNRRNTTEQDNDSRGRSRDNHYDREETTLNTNRPVPKKTKADPNTLFFCKTEAMLEPLREWLGKRKFNSVRTDLKDRIGNEMIGLSYVSGREGYEKFDKRGVIICSGLEMKTKILQIVNQYNAGRELI